MYAITGITGQVGGVVARTLLAARQPVRAVLRNAAKAETWRECGCEVALADFENPATLTTAFKGVTGVFVLPPPNFDPAPDFLEARMTAAVLHSALEATRPGRVVHLSTIGAQATRPNLLTQHTIIEESLSRLSIPVTFLRPAWFMENCSWDVTPAREKGVIPSFLQPLAKSVPMVATADVGRVAAELLQENWSGRRICELEGPHRVTPNEIAATFTRILGRPIRMEAVPRQTWVDLFKSQGMKNPTPRVQMLDGFNEGWIEFESGEGGARKGKVQLETVLRALIKSEGPAMTTLDTPSRIVRESDPAPLHSRT